jgi:zinc transport system ATP-binding protein
MKPQISIKDLNFSYQKKREVLKEVNLRVDEGDFLAIIGPNGGGKTTLLKLILGELKAKSGEIMLFNHQPHFACSHIGYVPQEINSNNKFPISVQEVVLMGLLDTKNRIFGYSKAEKKRALLALAEVNMQNYLTHNIGELSGGQRQRVMIARALISAPEMLILDEPTSNLDMQGQKQVYELLKKLNQTLSVIVVSHDFTLLLNYAKKIAYVNSTLVMHDSPTLSQTMMDASGSDHVCEVELLASLEMMNECSCGIYKPKKCQHG